MKRGDIYMVSLERPILIVSPTAFNLATQLPVICPITNGGDFAKRLGFSVLLSGIKTTGIVRCDQPRVLDLSERNARKVESLPQHLMDEVLARLAPLFQ